MWRHLSLASWGILLLSSTVFGQIDTGTITGVVSDPSGAVLPGATLRVRHQETGTSWSLFTNDEGLYVAPNLRPGTYSIKVEMPGFQSQERTGVVLRLQERVRLDFRLQIGEITEVISVTGAAPLLETETSNLGQVIEEKTIGNLPLNGRNFIHLALLSAGVTPSYRSTQRDNFVANGMRPIQNTYILDGMENKTHIVGFDQSSALAHKPSVDAIQEFKVQTSTFSAEYGQGAGAVVTATIRSGSNEFHGSLFEFHRNAALDARPFFQPPDTDKPQFLENQFGGTVGGPIKKNTAFFFFSYEGTRILSAAPRVGTVPTPDLREGNFGSRPIYDPDTVRKNPEGKGFIRDRFPNNQVPRERWDSVAARLLELYPVPNLAGTVNNHFYNPRQTSDDDRFDTRVDYKFRDEDNLFVRFSRTAGTNVLPPPLPDPANHLSTAHPRGHSAVLAYTRGFSPQIVSETRLGFNRTLLKQGIDRPRLFEEFGINEPARDPDVKGLPVFGISACPPWGPRIPREACRLK